MGSPTLSLVWITNPADNHLHVLLGQYHRFSQGEKGNACSGTQRDILVVVELLGSSSLVTIPPNGLTLQAGSLNEPPDHRL